MAAMQRIKDIRLKHLLEDWGRLSTMAAPFEKSMSAQFTAELD